MYDIVSNVVSILIVIFIIFVIDWAWSSWQFYKYKKFKEYQRENERVSEGKKSGFRKMLDEQLEQAKNQRKEMEERRKDK